MKGDDGGGIVATLFMDGNKLIINTSPLEEDIVSDFIDANLAGPGKETVKVGWKVDKSRNLFTSLILSEDDIN